MLNMKLITLTMSFQNIMISNLSKWERGERKMCKPYSFLFFFVMHTSEQLKTRSIERPQDIMKYK